MNIGDRVLIGGRTMLRPGFSLVGLEAVVMPTFPNAPEGCATVQIDWHGAGYTDEEKWGDLPPFINVPIAHLEIVEPEIVEPETPRPVLGLVNDPNAASEETAAAPETTPDNFPSDDSDDERPRLRLV